MQLSDVMPGFQPLHNQPLLDESIKPNMWLGNRAIVAPHYDINDNLACVAAGRRKFTLFPPDQINNLYLGPTLNTPAGVPISLVDIRNPDLKRFPKYKQALDAGFEATLNAGDAIFIPALWWHGVESLETFNILVNYWWGDNQENRFSPRDSLLHCMMSISKLDSKKRESWRHLFDYYVFKTMDEPSGHLPKDLNDILTGLSSEEELAIGEYLSEKLK
jgi:hypothetical protein